MNEENEHPGAYLIGHPQITFVKNVYKRHTDVKFIDKVYDFENTDQAMVELETHNRITCINCATITNNIKSLKMLIVPKAWTLSDVSNSQDVQNHKNTDEMSIIFSFTRESLYQLNKTMDILFNETDPYLTLPSTNNSILSYFIGGPVSNRKVIFYIEPDNQNISNQLQIKYSVLETIEEQKKFVLVGHEYLINQYYTHKIKISSGENRIPIHHLNIPLNKLFICSDNSMNLSCKLALRSESQLDNGNDPITHIYRLKNISTCGNNYKYSLDSQNCYFFNGEYSNMKYNPDVQPNGHISARHGSHLIINSDSNGTVNIMYSFRNVIRYIGGIMGLAYKFTHRDENVPDINNEFVFSIENPEKKPQVILDYENPEPEINQNIIANNNNGVIVEQLLDEDDVFINPNDLIEQDEVQPNDPTAEPYDLTDWEKWNMSMRKNFMDLKFKFIYSVIDKYCLDSAIKRKVEDGTICCIDCDKIEDGEYYYKCDQCTVTVKKENMDIWLFSKSFRSIKCLMCNKDIKVYPQLYINLAEDKEKIEEEQELTD